MCIRLLSMSLARLCQHLLIQGRVNRFSKTSFLDFITVLHFVRLPFLAEWSSGGVTESIIKSACVTQLPEWAESCSLCKWPSSLHCTHLSKATEKLKCTLRKTCQSDLISQTYQACHRRSDSYLATYCAFETCTLLSATPSQGQLSGYKRC